MVYSSGQGFYFYHLALVVHTSGSCFHSQHVSLEVYTTDPVLVIIIIY